MYWLCVYAFGAANFANVFVLNYFSPTQHKMFIWFNSLSSYQPCSVFLLAVFLELQNIVIFFICNLTTARCLYDLAISHFPSTLICFLHVIFLELQNIVMFFKLKFMWLRAPSLSSLLSFHSRKGFSVEQSGLRYYRYIVGIL